MMEWQWHHLDHMQIIYTLLRTDNHANTSPLSFYRSDALPATQPTASKQLRQYAYWRLCVDNSGICPPPFPQIDIIGAMVIVCRVRGKLSGLFFAILCTTVVHSAMHTHMNRPNSSLDCVLSHWAHFTVLRFIFVYVLLHACVVL